MIVSFAGGDKYPTTEECRLGSKQRSGRLAVIALKEADFRAESEVAGIDETISAAVCRKFCSVVVREESGKRRLCCSLSGGC